MSRYDNRINVSMFRYELALLYWENKYDATCATIHCSHLFLHGYGSLSGAKGDEIHRFKYGHGNLKSFNADRVVCNILLLSTLIYYKVL